MPRYAIFVHEPDGDSGYGRVVGPFKTPSAAEQRAEQYVRRGEREGFYIEAIVLPVASAAASVKTTVRDITGGGDDV